MTVFLLILVSIPLWRLAVLLGRLMGMLNAPLWTALPVGLAYAAMQYFILRWVLS